MQTQVKLVALHKTKHSQFCLDVFKSGKGLNVAHNDWFLANQFIEQSNDELEAYNASQGIRYLKHFIKENKLKCLYLAFAFDKEKQSYSFEYRFKSNIHNNNDLVVSGSMPNYDNVIFVMFPQIFAEAFNRLNEEIPFDELKKVARGE